ncbi:DoxX family protein [Aquipuribacter hungaricus]|uniref:DoxX family protein n=1 Tax=Aquipuribacter hungaricus TaxID=545624 RepID=A0ABV7WJQ5_9MICO
MFRRIARPLLAAVFVNSGIDALRNPEPRAKLAAGLVYAAAERFGTPDDPLLAARINGGVMVAGGLGLATGAAPRTSALALAGSLVPTTVAGHAFWEYPKAEQPAQRTQFLKNAGLLAGLLLTVDAPRAHAKTPKKVKQAEEAQDVAVATRKASRRSGRIAEKQAREQTKQMAKVEAVALRAQAKAEKAEARLERRRDGAKAAA